MMFPSALMSYYVCGLLPAGFLGLDGAPANNLQFYRERRVFANWCAKHVAKGYTSERMRIERDTLFDRLGEVMAIRGAEHHQVEAAVAIMILESSATNAGFGRDAHGTSTAIGPMQVKWAAVMDSGLPYEAYLDILTDRNPLIGVDAGAGYYLRMSRGRTLMDGVARYNRPNTVAATNRDYCKAFENARSGSMFEYGLKLALMAYERQMDVLRSAISAEG